MAFCRKGNYLIMAKRKSLGQKIAGAILQGTIEGIFSKPKKRKKR